MCLEISVFTFFLQVATQPYHYIFSLYEWKKGEGMINLIVLSCLGIPQEPLHMTNNKFNIPGLVFQYQFHFSLSKLCSPMYTMNQNKKALKKK